MSRRDEFHQSVIAARDVQPGDYLNPRLTVRVHRVGTLPDSGRTIVAWKMRGSKAPGSHLHEPDEEVKVWRKP